MKKRVLAAVFVAVFCLQMVGCGGAKQSEPAISNDGEVFSCTNQELVDLLNAGAEQNDISTIDYEEKSTNSSIIKSKLKLKLNPYKSDENPSEITLTYYSLNGEDAATAFGYYVGAILGLLDPESSDSISQEIFAFIESNPPDYDVSRIDGAHIQVSIACAKNAYSVVFRPLAVESDTAEE